MILQIRQQTQKAKVKLRNIWRDVLSLFLDSSLTPQFIEFPDGDENGGSENNHQHKECQVSEKRLDADMVTHIRHLRHPADAGEKRRQRD